MINNQAEINLALDSLKRKAKENQRLQIDESNYSLWCNTLFPQLKLKSFSEAHNACWNWGVNLQRGVRPDPIMVILARGQGKSTTAELLATYIGATLKRNYAWYISGTQALADMHLDSIASLVETEKFSLYYPKMAERRLNKYGSSKGWRRNRLSCGNGFTIEARGLDVGTRGLKVEEHRPGIIFLDDIDGLFDSDNVVQRKIDTITNNILPAGSDDLAVFCLQNLIRNDGFFGRVVNKTNDYLHNIKLFGPYKAIDNLVVDENYQIISGKATWSGMDLDKCQQMINE